MDKQIKSIRKGNRHTRNPVCKKNIFNIWNKNERISSSFMNVLTGMCGVISSPGSVILTFVN